MNCSILKVGFTAIVIPLIGFISSAFATPVVINFETDQIGNPLGYGTLISDQYDDLFTLSVYSDSRYTQPGMIFDTDNYTGGDSDLALNIGNALIISEDGDSNDPDDEAKGGKFIFNFTQNISAFGFTILDIEDPVSNSITFFDGANSSGEIFFSAFGLSGWGDGSIIEIAPIASSNFGLSQFDKIEISVNTSGAIGDVSVAPVPEPATMLLFGTGLIGLAGVARRKKK